MSYVIDVLPAADIDQLETLWRELLDHHLADAPHLAAIGPARTPSDSWRVRRGQYLQWLAAPFGDRQNTARSTGAVAPAGFGLLTFTHLERCQRSISVWGFASPWTPTAKQLVDVAQDTPCSDPTISTGGSEVGVNDQVLPFHRSAITVGKLLYPVAKQAVPGHQMPSSAAAADGVAATDHFCPFQCSASPPTAPPPAARVPTAQQLVSWRQNTPARTVNVPEARAGTTDHFLPVQCSASGRNAAPTRRAAEPTAQHRVAPGHQTLARLSAARPAGSGSALSDHLLPFQCSATGSCLAGPSVAPPTAQQFSAAGQDTPLKKVSADPGAFGLAVSDHFLPFQCSIKVRVTPDAVWSPTAQQELACGQLTPLSTRPGGAADATGGALAGVTASRAAARVRSRIMS